MRSKLKQPDAWWCSDDGSCYWEFYSVPRWRRVLGRVGRLIPRRKVRYTRVKIRYD